LSDLESEADDTDADDHGGDFGADDDEDEDDGDDTPTPTPRRGGTGPSSEELSKQLAAALEHEDYEKAAQIRDELNKRGHA
jgi:excinuclease UvrABC helicase subunit UvrB